MRKDWSNQQVWLENKDLDEVRKHINNLDFLIEVIREEIFDNNCKSDEKFLENLKETRKGLISQKEEIEKKTN